MMNKSFRRCVSCFIALLLLIPGLVFADATLANTSKMNTESQLLFVMLANKSEIKALKNSKSTYQLTLKNVNPYVIYFTNTPQRYTSKIRTGDFIKQWQTGSFKKSPPNAMIETVRLHHSFFKEHKQSKSYAVVLMHPVYIQSKNELTFTIKELSGSTAKLPDFSHAEYVALFIDNVTVCPDCVGF